VLNKGTAFTAAERKEHGLEGLLPATVETIGRQMERVMGHLEQKPSDLERYICLISLCDRNETLFYKTLTSDPARFVLIVYDPIIADACLAFGHFYRRSRGIGIMRDMKGRMAEVLRNWPHRDVRFICVSSSGRILGLGAIGANGMGIPIGKVFPGVCVHFEGWKGTDAIRLLARCSDKVLCYNDDIQGTASVAIAGLTTALQVSGTKLRDQRVFFLGAGSAGIGIANMIVEAMVDESLKREDAQKQIALFDVGGLIELSRQELSPSQEVYAHQAEPTKDLKAALRSPACPRCPRPQQLWRPR